MISGLMDLCAPCGRSWKRISLYGSILYDFGDGGLVDLRVADLLGRREERVEEILAKLLKRVQLSEAKVDIEGVDLDGGL